MRSASLLLALAAAVATSSFGGVRAQDIGDTTTYTRAGIVYTATIDNNYDVDTLNAAPIETLLGAVAPVTTTAAVVATTTTPIQQGGALGGGGGVVSTPTGLQTISGYNPPPSSVVPPPTNVPAGSIISNMDIPGYSSLLAASTSAAWGEHGPLGFAITMCFGAAIVAAAGLVVL